MVGRQYGSSLRRSPRSLFNLARVEENNAFCNRVNCTYTVVRIVHTLQSAGHVYSFRLFLGSGILISYTFQKYSKYFYLEFAPPVLLLPSTCGNVYRSLGHLYTMQVVLFQFKYCNYLRNF